MTSSRDKQVLDGRYNTRSGRTYVNIRTTKLQSLAQGETNPSSGLASEQDNEIAREEVLAGLPPLVVLELARPPAVLWRRGDSDDVAFLEVELLVRRTAVAIQRLDCTRTVSLGHSLRRARRRQGTAGRTRGAP